MEKQQLENSLLMIRSEAMYLRGYLTALPRTDYGNEANKRMMDLTDRITVLHEMVMRDA